MSSFEPPFCVSPCVSFPLVLRIENRRGCLTLSVCVCCAGQAVLQVETIEREQHIDSWIALVPQKSGQEVSGEIKVTLDLDFDGGTREKLKKKKETVAIVEEDIPLEDDDVSFAGQKVKIQELRKMSGVTRMKRTDAVGSAGKFMSEFLQLVDEIKPSLRLIQSNNRALKQIYGKYFVATTTEVREDLAQQMAVLIDVTNSESKKLTTKFKTIETSNAAASKDFNLRNSELRIRQNIYNVMSKSFLDAMLEFQDIQTQYKSRHRKTARQLYQVTNPNATTEELDQAESMDVQAVLKQAVVDVRRNQAKDALAYVKQRHQEILKIEKSLLELQRLFNDMAVLVSAQAEFIDRIQDNITVAKQNVKDGVNELRKARHYQSHKFKLSPVHLAKLMK